MIAAFDLYLRRIIQVGNDQFGPPVIKGISIFLLIQLVHTDLFAFAVIYGHFHIKIAGEALSLRIDIDRISSRLGNSFR